MTSASHLYNLFVMPPFWLALLIASVFAFTAFVARWLTRGGAFSAWLVGMIVLGFGGGIFLVPLLAFFLSSTLLSKVGRERKARLSAQSAKGATRDAGQVWANGGIAAAIVLVFFLKVHHWPYYLSRDLLMLYLAALATVNADTWSTEIGALSGRPPRLLTNWKSVPAGSSGAITGLGVAAAIGGALLIPLSALGLWHLDPVEFVAVTWAGFLGSLVDSVLGAGLQAQYRDPITGALTDRAEINGQAMRRVRGLAWVNNDVVNFLASASGVVFAALLLHYAGGPGR